MTERQAQVEGFVRNYSAQHGMPPTIREVAKYLSVSTPRAAEKLLKALERKGVLIHAKRQSRAYRLADNGGTEAQREHPTQGDVDEWASPHGTTIPIRGNVPAGMPSVEDDGDLGYLEVPMRVSPESFAVRVVGDSMRGAHILDGDLAVGDPSIEPLDRTVVIAFVDGGFTIKTLRRNTSTWWLESANDHFPPILPKIEEDRVEAAVVALYRTRLGKAPSFVSW